MASVTQFWTDPKASLFQAFGGPVEWTWDLGDSQFYWAFAVRPLQAAAVFLEAPLTANFTFLHGMNTQLKVTVSEPSDILAPDDLDGRTGTELRFTAIKVETP